MDVVVAAIHKALTEREGFAATAPLGQRQEGKELATGVYENKTTRLEVSCLAMGQVAVVSILHEGASAATTAQISPNGPVEATIHAMLHPEQQQQQQRSSSSSSSSQWAPPPASSSSSSRFYPYQPPIGDIGTGDLDPLGAGAGGGGMFAGPQIFRPGRAQSPYNPMGIGPTTIIPGSVPPGARFDPIYPGGDPSIDPSSDPARFRSGPDNDDFPPPGFPDMI